MTVSHDEATIEVRKFIFTKLISLKTYPVTLTFVICTMYTRNKCSTLHENLEDTLQGEASDKPNPQRLKSWLPLDLVLSLVDRNTHKK